MKNTNKKCLHGFQFLQSCATTVSWGFCQQNQKKLSDFLIKTITENVYVDHNFCNYAKYTIFQIYH